MSEIDFAFTIIALGAAAALAPPDKRTPAERERDQARLLAEQAAWVATDPFVQALKRECAGE